MPALLVSLDGHEPIPIDRLLVVVGRSPRCDVRLDSPHVSGRHCCLVRDGDGVVVFDLGSTNGTRINGRPVERGRLVPGDELGIARDRFRLEDDRSGVRLLMGPRSVETGGDHEPRAIEGARRRLMRGGSAMGAPRRELLCLAMLAVGIAVGRHTAPARGVPPGTTPGPSTAFAEGATPRPRGATEPPPSARAMVAERLFFGRAIPGGGSVSDEAWATFLREVVTPRFPEGLTVWRAEGQWTDSLGRMVQEHVMVVEVFHPASARADSALVEIAREYKRRFRQEVVLGASAPARVRFHE